MPDTLALTLTDLRGEVGFYLGYNRDFSLNDASQQSDIDASIDSGLRQFYFPASGHRWSFLSPLASLTVVEDVREYELPADLASLEGNMTFAADSNVFHVIQRVGIGEVNTRAQMSSGLTGEPCLVALVPNRTAGAIGQRFSAVFYPTPDQEYVLSFRYAVLPAALTTANPVPYGGVAHAETILESCLAVAESRIQDERGLHQVAFEDRIRASIAMDMRTAPDHLGYNGDASDRRAWRGRGSRSQLGLVTVNGVQYP